MPAVRGSVYKLPVPRRLGKIFHPELSISLALKFRALFGRFLCKRGVVYFG